MQAALFTEVSAMRSPEDFPVQSHLIFPQAANLMDESPEQNNADSVYVAKLKANWSKSKKKAIAAKENLGQTSSQKI